MCLLETGNRAAPWQAEKYLRSSDGAMKWVIVRPGGLSNKTPAEVGNIVVRGEDKLFGRKSDPGAPHALRSELWRVLCSAATE